MRLWMISILPAVLLLVAPAARSQDTDLDGLPDAREVALGTDPFDRDSDDDGLADGFEVDGAGLPRLTDPDLLWIPLTVGAGWQTPPESQLDPLDADTDGDGIHDGTELGVVRGLLGFGDIRGTDPALFRPDADPASTTDPRLADSDGGGLRDGLEDRNANGRLDPEELDPAVPGDDRFDLEVLVDVLRNEAHVAVAAARPGYQVAVFLSFAGAGRVPVGRGGVAWRAQALEARPKAGLFRISPVVVGSLP